MFLLLVQFGIAVLLFGQNDKYLIIEHREKQKEVVIANGEIVRVRSFKGEKLKGKIEILSESLVRVKHKVVPLTSIQSIGRKHKVVGRIASLLVTNGMNLFVYGVNDNLRNGWDQVSHLYKASIPMLGVGIPFLVVTKNRKAKKWTYVGQVDIW